MLIGPDSGPASNCRVCAQVPGTVAGALQAAGLWRLDSPGLRFDDHAWRYEAEFEVGSMAPGERRVLGFDGLATLAEVFLDGVSVLRSQNMFRQHEVDISRLPAGKHRLEIRFDALKTALDARRPRPRWRTPMVAHQQLRWIRTTLLGRTPGWSPPTPPVGPWRAIWLEDRKIADFSDIRCATEVNGGRGILRVEGLLRELGGERVTEGRVLLRRGDRVHTAPISWDRASGRIHAVLIVDDPQLWWPHTHGEPACYDASIEFQTTASPSVEVADLGLVGFRTLVLDTIDGGFAIRINEERIFCRGACWTPLDALLLHSPEQAYDEVLERVRTAGMNMVRVGGTMVYETPDFYDRCDRKGILVWQDLMFANMDYPEGNPEFVEDASQEVREHLAALSGRPCLALVCGNSEGAQQAAMWGAGRESWAPALFQDIFAALSREICPGSAYWHSSASGGPFPHSPMNGPSSYYGVGAYLRPPEDARRSEVRFASECLAFANVPDDDTLRHIPDGGGFRTTHPRWKERVPRDLGAGWDFDDVRDHYFRHHFGVDPTGMRYAEPARYLQLSRLLTGKVMAEAMEEWRRRRSVCHGALIWFLRDLWPGAGWGVIDSEGRPKAAWYALARSLQPVSVFFSDEGLNGLAMHVVNESAEDLFLDLGLSLFRSLDSTPQVTRMGLRIGPRTTREIPCTDLLDGFVDINHSYRFGPAPYSLAVAKLKAPGGQQISRASRILTRDAQEFLRPSDLGLIAVLARLTAERCRLTLTTNRFAYGVVLEAEAWTPDDQYFDLAPGETRVMEFERPRAVAAHDWRPAVIVRACNGEKEFHARVEE